MPLPMVHLSVAVSLCEKDGRFPSPDFLLGSIAPDAIHMRPFTRKVIRNVSTCWNLAIPDRNWRDYSRPDMGRTAPGQWGFPQAISLIS